MLMQGDMNKVIEEVNKVLEVAFNRVAALEDRMAELEGGAATTLETPVRGRGRPLGSKNKKKAA
jgi:hypothetical protein